MAVSQGLDLSQYEANDLILKFKARNTSSSYGRMDVGIMTDPTDLNTLTVLKAIYPTDYSASSTWCDFNVVLPAHYEDVVYLAFYAPAGYSNYFYLDDVVLEPASCTSPSHLTISNVAGTSALVSWHASPAPVDDYTVEYSEAGMETWTTLVTSSTSQALTGLTQGTNYQVRLFANCAEGDPEILQADFTTMEYLACTQEDTTGVAITGTSSSTNYYIPVNNFYNYTYSQQIFTANEITPSHTATVITALAFQYDYSSAMTDKTNVKIYLAHRSDSTFASTSDWTPISNATLVYEGSLNCHQGWNKFNISSYFPYNGQDNLVVIVDDKSGDYNGTAYVFNSHSRTNATLYYYNDSNNPDPNNPPTASSRYSYRSEERRVGKEC